MMLNEQQMKAVTHIDGPMLVLAGAGSGKTKVLTNRIAYLIENNISPYNILAITFTNKAAKEMKERVYKLIGETARTIQISTFHSFGLRMIKENYDKLGFDRNFSILDSDDSLSVIKRILKEYNLDPKIYNPKTIKNKISSAKNELISPAKYSNVEFDKNIVSVYERYERTLKSNNSLDFDDLLLLPIKLLEDPQTLSKYQDKYKYILIDEYQDTNEAQYKFCKKLASKYQNLFVVGDNDQAIYAFRGANYKNILNFEKDYPNCKTILLEENYRSTKNILNAANSVISNNKLRKEKKLWSNNEDGDKITYVQTSNEKEESAFVANKIKDLVSKGTNYEDIAILYRTNAQSRAIEEEMLKSNIPYRIVGSFYFYNRKEIKDLLCYLRLINNIHDDVSLLRAINTPKRGIGTKTIENIVDKAEKQQTSLFEAIESGKELNFKNLIIEIQNNIKGLTLTEIVELVLTKSGLREELKQEKSLENDIRLENLEEFKTITKNFEEEFGVVTLTDFLEEVTLVSDMSEHQDTNNKVSLMTVHSVKGLEYDNVFVIGMEEEIFPHYNSLREGTNTAIEEERRLCYVAITRAKKRLWLTNTKKRTIFGQTQTNQASRFIDEIEKKYLNIENQTNSIFSKTSLFMKNKKENLNNNTNTNTNFEKGDTISHTEYGIGVVTMVDKLLITVAFPYPYGVKKLLKTHKSITKL